MRSLRFLIACLATLIPIGNGCDIQGITNAWLDLSVTDTDSGIFFQGMTENIGEILSATHSGDILNFGPYFVASHENEQFILSLHENFAQYERHETLQSFSISVTFSCTNGNAARTIIFIVSVIDTNNNAPIFTPLEQFSYTVTPPLPPGYQITGCNSDINVEDIDLTTQSIEFNIVDDDGTFEIVYDPVASTPKNFKGILRTKNFVRSIPEPLTLTISATDVDETGDPPRTTFTTVTIVSDGEFEFPDEPVFTKPFYMATYTSEHQLTIEPIALLQGYTQDVHFSLAGDYQAYFNLVDDNNAIQISLAGELPDEVLIDEKQLYLIVNAEKELTSGASSTIIVQLPEAETINFEQQLYEGTIIDNVLAMPALVLSQGYENGYTVTIESEYSSSFAYAAQGNTITITLTALDDNVIEANNVITLQVIADSVFGASTAVVSLSIIKNDTTTPLFENYMYTGSYDLASGLALEDIVLSQGYDQTVSFYLEGEHENLFTINQDLNVINLQLNTAVPEDILQVGRDLLLTLTATKARTVGANTAISISLPQGDTTAAEFDKALYRGVYDGSVQHEPIAILGYEGTEVQISGEYQELFAGQITSGVVEIQVANPVAFSDEVLYVALELSAGGAQTALLIDIDHSEQPTPPTLAFDSASYEISIDSSQTGLVGRVTATASNAEPIVYSMDLNNAHLQERLSISSEGELQLFAAADIGAYSFTVTASTAASQVSATTTVLMSVGAATVCGDENHGVSPLIVINRDEEENHSDLVVLNTEEFPGCHYELTNRWPLNQNWLYVDDVGLHTIAIDREDESVAFMALSQIQVELMLLCESDVATMTSRAKRDIRPDWLGPYDYGNNEWILTETIPYNSRRSLVNLIVNDVNDNAPIFNDKENEPIAVGYPVPDLLNLVAPRALVQLLATDKDIGINAELLYWSSAPELAVSPNSGMVHVRDNERNIEGGTLMTVHATDMAGEGLTGDIDIVVRLLDDQHIAVLTIRDAFEEDEAAILGNLTNAVGYQVKSLTSVVVSDEYANDLQLNTNSRRKRQAVESRGASLKLFVYGLIERDPVDVSQLTDDINNNVIVTVSVADTISLQDYLAGLEICEVVTGRDVGLLVATIVLSIILFILIVLIGLWYFLKWRKGLTYEEFSDLSSVTSRNDSTDYLAKAEQPTRPRLNIEEIKRSERRLREMLDAPIEEDISPPTIAPETVVEIPVNDTSPIVIQSIDKLKDADDLDEDEFGETKGRNRKKSVVTFNENVEKIIHVESGPDDNDDDIEIYKL